MTNTAGLVSLFFSTLVGFDVDFGKEGGCKTLPYVELL